MGMDFLYETETLSKHTDRLVEQLVPGMQSLRVNSVGSPKRSIMCRLDEAVGCATVDTGSDLDLVSPDFVHARSFNVTPAYELVEFADCSIATTSGVVTTRFSLGGEDEEGVFRPQGGSIDLDFYVLDNLNADILVGQGTIDELKVFTKHSASFIYNSDLLRESGVNIIRHKGRLEQQVERGMQKIKNIFTSSSNSSSKLKQLTHKFFGAHESSGATTDPIMNVQRENARRERERSSPQLPSLRIHIPPYTPPSIGPASGSPVSPTGATIGDSDEEVSDEEMSNEPVTAPNSPTSGYFCNHPGCTAPPFQTQYLLNSHANVHSSARPHYCPVQGCPRGIGGKGFKRKNEMIRHGLVHDSPGYVCPFCPDRRHRYPRPDQLQQHVRVHHVDKDKDDPVLRSVLSQKPPSRNRGRRWRGSPTS
ncbi:hypothetical protein NM208_g14352 [Fusarium decemcellulare]|uniref:Uncharacterized protein n=1 Tax=Fusarium decemcellulare TaxID=57161 RepID=A0ACC1RJV8_9HYPO|nr:hypothetical protein NM208_g14352 [Fusarium decemcellulare]